MSKVYGSYGKLITFGPAEQGAFLKTMEAEARLK
jgi:hypothetical protein